ncbi:glycosyltransferase, partial [Providencia heimbachae]|uniref:glycosyltransferase n=1 Tax=Providencia heimbachae TaxID=333962 RepID=UPI002240DA97
NGINTNLFYKIKSIKRQKNLILSVGSLSFQKDYPNLLHALKILCDDGYDDFHLVIVGEGPLKSELVNLSIELEIQDQVEFIGIRNDIPSLMSKCDIFILPSAWEGFGLVVAEAMACENMVIATDCGGVKSVISDCGFLVPPRDSKALSAAILDVISLKEYEKIQLGKKARNRIINFYSIEKMASNYFN